MQSCPRLCKNRPADKYMTLCIVCARKRACMHTEPTYVAYNNMQHEYSRIMIAAKTQRPNLSHVIHDMHLAWEKKMANVFRQH